MHDPNQKPFPSGSIRETFGDQSSEFMEKIVGMGPSILYVFDLIEMRNIWVNRSMFLGLGYTPDEIAELGSDMLQTLMHPDDWARYPDHFHKLQRLAPDEVARFEYRMKGKDGAWHWLASEEMAFTYHDDGSVSQIIGAAHDVSDARNREEKINLLVREMNHRIKNMFTVILSMISLTAKTKASAPTAEAFETVAGRVRALSVSQSLSLPATEENPTSCRDLVKLILQPYMELDDIEILGDDPSLGPDQAQSLAMVLHEMATNAVKYGSLSAEDGQLSINIEMSHAGEVTLKWSERSSVELNAVANSSKAGFGSKLIRRSIEQARGTIELDWQPSGLCATIKIPAYDS